jgi:hypothetical protein
MGSNTYVVEVTARQGPLKPTLTHTFEQTDGATRYPASAARAVSVSADRHVHKA